MKEWIKGLNRDYVTIFHSVLIWPLAYSPLHFSLPHGILYLLPPHLLLSAVGLVVLGWTSRPQYLREGSLESYLSCRQCISFGYGRQLLALSLDGCWISVSSSSWTCLKWPSCNVLCCVSFDLCLFMEGLPVMCVLTGVRVYVCIWVSNKVQKCV